MKKEKLNGIIIGIVIGAMLIGITASAAWSNWLEAYYNNIKIVVDGKQITPIDANGKIVEPFIVDGTTYLPVRAVGEALHKEVYWDGSTSTVYLGEYGNAIRGAYMSLEEAVNVGNRIDVKNGFTDNYGNYYDVASYSYYYMGGTEMEYLLDGKYSSFSGCLCVNQGDRSLQGIIVTFIADGKTIYTSPELTKSAKPISFNVNLNHCNDFKIRIDIGGENPWNKGNGIYFANCGFYE